MRYPVDQPYRITQGFGSHHPGIDIAPVPAGAKGRPCYAPEDSIVIASAYKPALEGNYIMLQGKETGKYYYFGHFEQRKVSVGAQIPEGAIIGILGMTGLATGVHTHCEVRLLPNGKQINPTEFFNQHINNNQGEGGVNQGKADNYTVQALAEGGLGRTAAGDKNLLNNIGRPVNDVIDTFRSYPEWKIRQEKANKYDALAKENAELKKYIEQLTSDFEPVAEQLYRKK